MAQTILERLAAASAPVQRALSPKPPTSALPYEGPLPASVAYAPIRHQERVACAGDPRAAMAFVATIPLESIFDAYGSLPAIAGTQPISECWGAVGARRRVLLADGRQAAEEILVDDEGVAFSYMAFGFSNEASALAAYAIGSFAFAPDPRGVAITWTYEYFPKSRFTRPPLWFFVRSTWRDYMRRALANLAAKLEARFAPSAAES